MLHLFLYIKLPDSFTNEYAQRLSHQLSQFQIICNKCKNKLLRITQFAKQITSHLRNGKSHLARMNRTHNIEIPKSILLRDLWHITQGN